MGIVVAVILAAVIGAGAKDGVFRKGYDRTTSETLAFERHALQEKLARTQEKRRTVIELSGADSELAMRRAKLDAQQEKIEAKIDKIDKKLQSVD